MKKWQKIFRKFKWITKQSNISKIFAKITKRNVNISKYFKKFRRYQKMPKIHKIFWNVQKNRKIKNFKIYFENCKQLRIFSIILKRITKISKHISKVSINFKKFKMKVPISKKSYSNLLYHPGGNDLVQIQLNIFIECL